MIKQVFICRKNYNYTLNQRKNKMDGISHFIEEHMDTALLRMAKLGEQSITGLEKGEGRKTTGCHNGFLSSIFVAKKRKTGISIEMPMKIENLFFKHMGMVLELIFC